MAAVDFTFVSGVGYLKVADGSGPYALDSAGNGVLIGRALKEFTGTAKLAVAGATARVALPAHGGFVSITGRNGFSRVAFGVGTVVATQTGHLVGVERIDVAVPVGATHLAAILDDGESEADLDISGLA